MDKKGVSQVVSTILILLIVIIAVGIVWVVIERIVRGGGGLVEEKAQCFEVFLEFPEGIDMSCNNNTGLIGNVSVSRGADSAGSVNMKIIVEGEVSADISAPDTLGTAAVSSPPSAGAVVDQTRVLVKVAPVVGEDLDVVCDPTDEKRVICQP
jgi:hypothetical protein